MRLVDSRTGIEVVSRKECLALLADEEVGRLAVVDGYRPVILPVNYALVDEAIVFRTAPGTKLRAGRRTPVCFEVDRFDRATRSGLSVLVHGQLEELTEYSGHLGSVRKVAIDPWATGERTHWMRIAPSRITGRRVGPAK